MDGHIKRISLVFFHVNFSLKLLCRNSFDFSLKCTTKFPPLRSARLIYLIKFQAAVRICGSLNNKIPEAIFIFRITLRARSLYVGFIRVSPRRRKHVLNKTKKERRRRFYDVSFFCRVSRWLDVVENAIFSRVHAPIAFNILFSRHTGSCSNFSRQHR